MKVLFISNFNTTDFLKDSFYHGLIDSGFEVYETDYPGYMMSNYDLNNIHSKGFTLYGLLNHTPNIESTEIIIQKIQSNFYDIIVYGCIYEFPGINTQCLDYLDYVKISYPKDKVHFLDGGDDFCSLSSDRINQLELNKIGNIWKTSLYDINIANPIFFGIPESKLITYKPQKEKFLAEYHGQIPLNKVGVSERLQKLHNDGILPNEKTYYSFSNEKDYYKDYESSYYGITIQKGQWLCLRHYEILANRCIPYFPDLENCPKYIMTNFPKKIIIESNKWIEKNQIHPQYDELNDYLFDYTKNHLTTKKLVNTIL